MLQENIIIFRKIFRHRKHILLATMAAAVISFGICMLLKPSYRSIAYVYPTNLVVYSEESTTEQLLQFMNSKEVGDYMRKKYNLCAHYRIDTTKKTFQFSFEEMYDRKVSISKTKYESIEIRVDDNDPDTARMLANGIIEGVNRLIEKEHREKYLEAVKNAQLYVNYKKHEVDSCQKLLTELSEKNGLVNISVQLKEAARNQYKLWATGGKNTELSGLMDNIKKLGVEQGRLALYFDDQLRGWAWAHNDYQKKLAEYNHKFTFTTLASKPTRPVVAAWPQRTLVTVISGIAMFILACLYFVFIDKIKNAYEQIASEK